jgi:hypothetical protein
MLWQLIFGWVLELSLTIYPRADSSIRRLRIPSRESENQRPAVSWYVREARVD